MGFRTKQDCLAPDEPPSCHRPKPSKKIDEEGGAVRCPVGAASSLGADEREVGQGHRPP